MRAILVAGFFLFVAMAGCLGSDDGLEGSNGENGGSDANGSNGSGGATGGGGTDREVERVDFGLDHLAECDFDDISCTNELQEVTVETRDRPSTLADQLICVQRTDQFNFEIWVFWDPIEDTFGIYYEAEGVSGVHGMIHQPASGVSINWYDGPENGWIPSVGLVDGEDYRITVYGISYETDTPELQGGSIRSHWSLLDGSPYPLQVVNADREYYFNNVTSSEGSAGFYHRPKSFDLVGDDFDISVEYQELYHTLNTNFGRMHRLGCALT